MRRALAALLCACAVAAAAACGGSSGDEASEPATTATAPAPAPTAPGGDLAALLPPEDAVGGLRPGVARELPTPQAFVAAFYLAGDRGRAAAQRRLAAGGYAEGLVRDQPGEDPEGGVALVRSYVVVMRDEEAARQEVADATDDVLDSPQGTASEIELSGIEGGRALRVELSQDEVSGSAVFVTFPAGPRVYGIQAASREGADLPEDEVVAAAQDLAARVGAAP